MVSRTDESEVHERDAALGAELVAELYERYHAEVFHLALRYGRGSTAWAEDVTQDVFLNVARLKKSLADHEALSGWFYRVTTRRCLNRLRREAFARTMLGRLVFGEPQDLCTPERQLLARNDLERAFLAVGELPVKERAAFYMRYVDDKSQNEIAEVLGHSKGYVSKLLQRACQRLERQGWKVEDD